MQAGSELSGGLGAPSEAWARGKDEIESRKPRSGIQRESYPARQSGSAAGTECCVQDGEIRTTKRTQGVCRPCDRASKDVSMWEPTSSNQRKAALQSRKDLAEKSTGVKEQGMQT